MERAAKDPTTLIIFGATGDLARRKLLPALFHLYSNGYLPEFFRIVGLSRDELTSAQYRDIARRAITGAVQHHRAAEVKELLTTVSFQKGLFEDRAAYSALGQHLHSIDQRAPRQCCNKLFYLAVPPNMYAAIFDFLAASGLTIPCGGPEGWTRVLVEKPFGRDLLTAQALDRKLGKLFREEQIFRIDHYLAKETVQNIITFRFANAIFEPVWDYEDIAKVDISMHETIGVGERASFYEDVGALRDVGQNHLLQMLALIAMEDPKVLQAEAIRTARRDVLKHLVPITAKDVERRVVRGQYRGYRTETAVARESETETYFKVVAYVNNRRWRGVPFTLQSGKKLKDNTVEIQLTFKEPISCVCPDDDQLHQNVLTIRVQPDEGISLRFWAKRPGLTLELEPRTLSFYYKDSPDRGVLPDAYEKVLYDCIRGDQTLFASTEEVAAAWRFITPILKHWQKVPLQEYEPGSSGPTTQEPRTKF